MDREFTTASELETMLDTLHTLRPVLRQRRDDGEISKQEWENALDTLHLLGKKTIATPYPTTFSQFLEQHVPDPNLRETIKSLVPKKEVSSDRIAVTEHYKCANWESAMMTTQIDPLADTRASALKDLCGALRTDGTVGCVLPIVASSGSGKSFLIRSLASMIPVHYVSFAPKGHFPPRSRFGGALSDSLATSDGANNIIPSLMNAAINWFKNIYVAGTTYPSAAAEKNPVLDCLFDAQISSDAYTKLAHEAFTKTHNLSDTTSEFFKVFGTKLIIIVIDECRYIVTEPYWQTRLYEAVRNTPNAVLILLDTNGRLSEIIPPVDRNELRELYMATLVRPSNSTNNNRPKGVKVPLSYPIFAKPWGQPTFSSPLCVKTLARYGRPLWRAYYDNFLKAPELKGSYLVELAQEKLLGVQTTKGALDLPLVTIAVFSCTSGLDFRASRQTHEQLVGNHMATFVTADLNQNDSYVCYFPEPVLGWAARMFLRETHNLRKCIESFNYQITRHVKLKGLIGEIIARLVCVLSVPEIACLRDSSAPLITSVNGFLSNLMPLYNLVKSQIHVDDHKLSLIQFALDRDEYADQRTQRLKKMGAAISDDHKTKLTAAFNRGIGICGSHNQEGFDFAIPISIVPDAVSDSKRFNLDLSASAIYVSVKNCEQEFYSWRKLNADGIGKKLTSYDITVNNMNGGHPDKPFIEIRGSEEILTKCDLKFIRKVSRSHNLEKMSKPIVTRAYDVVEYITTHSSLDVLNKKSIDSHLDAVYSMYESISKLHFDNNRDVVFIIMSLQTVASLITVSFCVGDNQTVTCYIFNPLFAPSVKKLDVESELRVLSQTTLNIGHIIEENDKNLFGSDVCRHYATQSRKCLDDIDNDIYYLAGEPLE